MSFTSAVLSRWIRPPLAQRLGVRRPVPAAVAVGAVTFAVAAAGLIAVHKQPRLALAKGVALSHAVADPVAGRTLHGVSWSRVDVIPLDSHVETLAFSRGGRLVAMVDVGFNGRVAVLDSQDLTRQKFVNGSGLAHDRLLLAVLSLVFILVSAVWPLWRIRNLDVMVAVGTVASIVLLDRWQLRSMVIASYPILFYLAIRCAWRGLAPGRDGRPATTLFEHLTRRWTRSQQIRLLRWVAIAAALIVAMVGVTSLHVLDVGIAVMEGATAIVHGLLPYGHIPDVFHGDTYPFGSYLLYVPFALFSPANNGWDNVDVTLFVATAAALLAAFGLLRTVAPRRRDERSRVAPQQEIAGLLMAIALLTFPPLLVAVSTGTTDVALAAMLVGALALWRRPSLAIAVLSVAGWFKLVPAALLPLWLARLRGRALLRGLAAILLVSFPMLVAMIALGGLQAPRRMLSAMSFQLTREAPTLWTQFGSVPFQQLVQAATLALILGAAVRLRTDRELVQDRARFAALCGAVLLGLQISGNYWSYMYLVWVLPFLALALLGSPETDGKATLNPLPDRAARTSAGIWVGSALG